MQLYDEGGPGGDEASATAAEACGKLVNFWQKVWRRPLGDEGGALRAWAEGRPATAHPLGWEPLTAEELWEKFSDCAQRALPTSLVSPLFDTLQSFEKIKDIRQITALMQPAKG
jgi:hypothetical protein